MQKNCLVIIDMQKGFVNEHTADIPGKIAGFVGRCGGAFDKIVATRYINAPDTACYKFEHWESCMAGSEETELAEPIKPLVSRVFDKSTYSAFFNEEFRGFLETERFDKVYFCGVNTGCCVLATVLPVYDSVQDCAVIEDLCGSTTGGDIHRFSVEVIKSNITAERVVLSSSFSDM
jgi:nicotinamidase-related amidase